MLFFQLKESKLLPKEISALLRNFPRSVTENADLTPLREVLRNDPSVLATLGLEAVSGRYSRREDCADAVTALAKEQILLLERGLPVLEVMVSVAPLLGLLGTTIGLVGMFAAMGNDSGGDGSDTAAVAREIGVALRCTIAGLFVAVPSVMAHAYFSRKLDRIAIRIETILQYAINQFYVHFEVKKVKDIPEEKEA
jgi:biopolymer transport protein ExbB